MTIIFEFHKRKNQIQLLQFMFETHNVKTSKNGSVRGCSLDKYLTLDVWSQIYAKLEDKIERAAQQSIENLKSDTIHLKRAQLELKITYEKIESYHQDIIKKEFRTSDIYPHLMCINVETFSDIRSYKKEHPNTLNSRLNGIESKDDEYIPLARCSIDETASYTPSKVIKRSHSNEEYTPPGVIASDGLSYSPQKIKSEFNKIEAVSSSSSIQSLTSTDYNENKCHTVTTKSNGAKTASKTATISKTTSTINKPSTRDLFGDSDDDQYTYRTRSKVENNRKKEQTAAAKLTDWYQTDRHKKDDTKTTKLNENEKIKSSGSIGQSKRKMDGSDSSNINQKVKKIDKNKEIAMLEDVNKMLADANKPVQDIGAIINIKHISCEEIVASFDKHKDLLNTLFHQLKGELTVKALEPKDMNFLTILKCLVGDDQRYKMIETLEEKFSDSGACNNLIWNRLLPEWALAIFMSVYKMNRKQAIDRLNQQDRYEEQNSNEFDHLFD